MKKITSISILAIFIFLVSAPIVNAKSEYHDGFLWYHYVNSTHVHSEYNNDQPHSASVTARKEKLYRYTSYKPYQIVGLTLHTNSGGKKAYYNYW